LASLSTNAAACVSLSRSQCAGYLSCSRCSLRSVVCQISTLLKCCCVLVDRAKISDAELKRWLVQTDKHEGLSRRMSRCIRHLVSMPQNNKDELMLRLTASIWVTHRCWSWEDKKTVRVASSVRVRLRQSSAARI